MKTPQCQGLCQSTQILLCFTIREGLYELVRVVVVHAAGVGEQVEVLAHAEDGAAQLAVLELEVLAPEVEELLHLFLGQLTLNIKKMLGL